MNMERKYIEKTIEDMEREITISKKAIEMFHNEIEESAWHRGYISSSEKQIEFLEQQIRFLKAALED